MPFSLEFLEEHNLIQHDDSSIQREFTTTPTGVFSIDRFRKGRNDYWVVFKKKIAAKEKKALIVTDWNLLPNQDYQFIELLNEGFPLYLWTGKLVKIEYPRFCDPFEIADFEYGLKSHYANVQPALQSEILNACADIGIEASKIKIIDYFENQALQKGDKQLPSETSWDQRVDAGITKVEEKILYLKDLLDPKNLDQLEKILISMQGRGPITLSISDVDWKKCDPTLVDLLLTTLPINKLSIENMFGYLPLSTIAKFNLAKITSLSLNNFEANLGNIHALFAAAPNLEEFTIDGIIEFTHLDLPVPPPVYKNLKTLRLGNNSRETKTINDNNPEKINNLASLLTTVPNVENLQLILAPKVEEALLDAINQLSKLKSLYCTSTEIMPSAIPYMIAKHPELISAKFFYTKSNSHSRDFDVKDITFPALKELTLSVTDMEMNAIVDLLEQLGELETLYIMDNDIHQLDVGSQKLGSLKNLKLNCDIDNLNQLNNFTAIENLAIVNPIEANLEVLNLPNLKSIECNQVYEEAYHPFLKKHPNIETLKFTLYGDFNANDSLNFNHYNLSRLRHLDIKNLSETQLCEYLSGCPMLESLNVDALKRDGSNPIVKLASPHLQVLRLNLIDLAFPSAKELLKQCSHVKELTLSSCYNFESLNSMDIYLPSVETLQMPCFDLQSFHFITKFPNLTELRLDWPPMFESEVLQALCSDINYPGITHLDLSEVVPFSVDFPLTGLLRYFPSLKKLTLSEDLASRLGEGLSRLKEINIKNSRGTFTSGDFNLLQAKNPNLKISLIDHSISRQDQNQQAQHMQVNNANATGLYDPSKNKIDANTAYNSNTTSDVLQYFLPKADGLPFPNYYRNQVSTNDFNLHYDPIDCPKTNDIDNLKEKYFENEDDRNFFLGKLKLYNNERIALPSLTPEDHLLALATTVPVEITYCPELNLHFIQATEPLSEPVDVAFTIHAQLLQNSKAFEFPEPNAKIMDLFSIMDFENGSLTNHSVNLLKSNLQYLSYNIRAAYIANFCRSFGTGELTDCQTEDDILNNIIYHRVGACRHRCEIFSHLSKALDIKCRIISNGCHRFVEVENPNGTYTMVCLGGYPVRLNTMSIADESKPNLDENVQALLEKNKESVISANQPNIFNVWEKEKTLASTSYDQFCHDLMLDALQLPAGKRNLLVSFDTKEQLQNFQAAMARYTTANGNASIYIDRFSDVNENELIIDDNNKSKFFTDPTLRAANAASKGDVLTFNLAEYGTSAVSYCNALTDDPRKLLKTPVGEGMTIIGVKLNDTSLGPDVYSRFSLSYRCPTLPKTDVYNGCVIPLEKSNIDLSDAVIVDCYDGSNWRDQLVSKYTVQGENFAFKKGKMTELLETMDEDKALKRAFENKQVKETISKTLAAIASKQHYLVIYNPPMNDPEFQQFLLEVTNNKQLHVNGENYKIPDNFKIVISNKTYDLNSDQYQYTIEKSKKSSNISWQYQLNCQTLNLFFQNYSITNDHMYETDGWLKQHAGTQLNIFVNDNLDDALWAKLLDTAHDLRCQLHFIFAEGVAIPQAMLSREQKMKSTSIKPPRAKLMTSNDKDLLVHRIKQRHKATLSSAESPEPDIVVINIDEKVDFTNIVEYTSITQEKDTYAFESQIRCVLQALRNKKKVVLQGNLSKELTQYLQTLWANPPYLLVNGQKEDKIEGELIIVTDEKNKFDVSSDEEQFYIANDIWENLAKEFPQAIERTRTIYEKFVSILQYENITFPLTFAQAKAMLALATSDPSANFLKPFVLLHPHAPKLVALSEQFFPKKTVVFDNADDVINHRLAQIKSAFAYSPFAFIVGGSGSGKSTFVIEELPKHANTSVRVGIEALFSWATDASKNQKILFIDEANLEEQEVLNIFEGLFNQPPAVLYQGILYPLTESHKVIFAGNPANYAKRREHALFRHGGAIEFEPLPDLFLIEKILRPTLNRLKISQQQEYIMQSCLEFYHEAQNYQVPMTPRNLANMVLRLKILLDQGFPLTGDVFKQHVWLAIFNEVENIKNKNSLAHLRDFVNEKCDITKLQSSLNEKFILNENNNYLCTESRVVPLSYLQEQLKMRELQLNYPSADTSKGSAGILFEGTAGVGKTKLVIEHLKSQGYENASDPFYIKSASDALNKTYYHIAPSNDEKKLEEILTKAFHEGAIVVIDEFSSFNLEKVLNRLMSGVDMQGDSAKNPGFLVIATQNPISYQGRQALSIALENRFIKLTMPDYPAKELKEIALYHAMLDYVATRLTDDMINSLQVAKEKSKKPIPTFRDFDRVLKELKHFFASDVKGKFIFDVLTYDLDFSKTNKNLTKIQEIVLTNRLAQLKDTAYKFCTTNKQFSNDEFHALQNGFFNLLAAGHFKYKNTFFKPEDLPAKLAANGVAINKLNRKA